MSANKRNLWTDPEVQCMLDVMKEKKVLSLLVGKKYKNENIYLMIEKEMKNFGFINKSADQITLKWRKLKAEYIKALNKNKVSGSERTSCAFFDELSEILGTSFEGIDSSDKENVQDSCDNFREDIPESNPAEQCIVRIDEITSDDSTVKAKRRKKASSSYEKSVSYCTQEFLSAQKKLQDAFLEKEKELIDYEHELQKKSREGINAGNDKRNEKTITRIQ